MAKALFNEQLSNSEKATYKLSLVAAVMFIAQCFYNFQLAYFLIAIGFTLSTTIQLRFFSDFFADKAVLKSTLRIIALLLIFGGWIKYLWF